ncbi:hypothetical protein ACKKBF_B31175 [Auxenochlorella protothecoides x Auxenochlorella symbiontica]
MHVPRPTHFLALPLNHVPGLQAAVRAIQTDLVGCVPSLAPTLVDPASLHITLGVLSLQGEEACREVADVAHAVLHAATPPAPSITLTGLSDFNHRVLYWDLVPDAGRRSLVRLADLLEQGLVQRGLMQPSRRPFTPHLTLAKVPPASPRLRQAQALRDISAEAYSANMGATYGPILLSQLQLCAMRGRLPGCYYPTLFELSLDGA